MNSTADRHDVKGVDILSKKLITKISILGSFLRFKILVSLININKDKVGS